MNFVELKKHVQSNDLYCCYNLYGDDSFLIDSSINFFFDYVAKDELSRTKLNAENFDAKSLISILNTSSFFGGRKVVLIKDVDVDKDKQIIDAIMKYQQNPNSSNILIITSKNPIFDEKKMQNLNKLSKFLCNVDCNRLDNSIIIARINSVLHAQNAAMTDEAKWLLINYTNGYLARIELELSKLMSYAGQREIIASDVKLLVNKELEYSVFELTESLGQCNEQKSYEILNDMMADKKMAPTVFGLIQNHFRRMFFSAITPKTNVQIADMLGVKEYAVKKSKEQAQNFTKINLKNIVDLCADLDFKIKTSQIGYQNAVQYLVSYILINSKK